MFQTRIKHLKTYDLVPNQDFIVIVRIFPPSKVETGGKTDFSKSYTQEIILHSNNLLADLRDSILCIEDYQECTGDISEMCTSEEEYVPMPTRNKVSITLY